MSSSIGSHVCIFLLDLFCPRLIMDMEIRELDGGAVFTAKIVPGSSGNTRICGVLDGMLKIKVAAPPEKGKANQCLLKFLARALNVKKNALNIISGQTSPIKRVQVSRISAETLQMKLKQELQGLAND